MKLISTLLVISLARCGYSGEFFAEVYPNISSRVCPDTTPIYFGLIMSFDGQQFDGSGAVPGVRVALDRINGNCSLLPGYSLHYTLADSRCMRTTGLDALFRDTIIPGPTKIAVIGSGCSPATEPTAEVSHYYNISQLSCVSSSPSLTDRTRFRKYFQLLSSEDSLAYAYYGVIKVYGWNHVSLIVQQENLFTVTIDRLKDLLRMDGIDYDERMFSSDGGVSELGEQPFNTERRIHLIASYAGHARQLICEAYDRDISLPRHVLLTPAWYANNWWRLDDANFNYTCTADQRESVLNNSLAFLHFNFLNRNNSNVTSDDGLAGDDYFIEESKYLGVEPHNFTQSEYAQYCYDATWTLAYALQDTINDIQDNATNQNLRSAYGVQQNGFFELNDFNYESDALNDIIFSHLNNTAFNGITGKVAFSDQGVRAVNTLRIFQFRSFINWVEIGQVTGTPGNDTSYDFEGESVSSVWPNGIPYDGVPTNETVHVSPALTAVYSILTTAGIVFACACLTFNFIFRDKKLIRLTSPNLNYMIGAGAIVLYVNLYLFVIPTTDPGAISVLCNITPWLTAIGYSLCYGTIVARMTRVYFIFNNPKPNRKIAIKDWMLALGVLFLIVIDVVILLIYTAVEGSKMDENGRNGLAAMEVINRENTEDVQGELGQITRYFVYVCDSTARDIFLGVLYGYKALLQVIALVFSFSIRKVKVKGLDDAKFIAVSIYVSSIVLAVIIVSTYTLKDFVNVFPAVFCTGFLIGTTVILGLVFIPLMVGLYRDPEGDTIFDKSNKSTTTINNNLQTQTIEGLRKRVFELETMVTENQNEFTNGKNGAQKPKRTSVTFPTEPPIKTVQEITQDQLEDMIGSPSERTRSNTIWDDPHTMTAAENNHKNKTESTKL